MNVKWMNDTQIIFKTVILHETTKQGYIDRKDIPDPRLRTLMLKVKKRCELTR